MDLLETRFPSLGYILVEVFFGLLIYGVVKNI